MKIKPIAYIHTELPEKFGIPRQSGLAGSLKGVIVFEREYRNPDALRGLDGFSHLWLIWEFSANRSEANSCESGKWSPTVRPPRLGGNTHVGVFATRSPFRPNPLGLSCVKIVSINLESPDGPVIHVAGADLMDGTPIYDIKPYIRYADSHPEALCSYVDELPEAKLEVVMPEALSGKFGDKAKIAALIEILQLDPRPSYHNDTDRVYGLSFGEYNVRFKVNGHKLEVIEVL